MRRINGDKGFTLIEVIVSLLVLAIVSAIAGMGIVSAVQSYVFTRVNTENSQQAQLAMTRIRLEFINMDSIMASDSNAITFTTNDTRRNVASSNCYTIARNGNLLTVQVTSYDAINNVCGNSGPTNTLTDRIGTYGAGESLLTYCRDIVNNTCVAWSAADGFQNLYAINILLVIPRADGLNDMKFSTYVNPRRNGAANAPLPKT